MALVAMALAVGLPACRDEPTNLAADSLPPRVQVVFPTTAWPFGLPTTWDRDSNGLIELEVAWADSSGVVLPQSVRVVSLDGVPGAPPDTNLAKGWRQVRLDSAGAVFEETIPLLLRSGSSRLVVSVTDTAGNTGADTLTVGVPPGALHRVIDLAYQPAWQQVRGVNLALIPDGSKGLAPFIGRVAVFDPEGITPTRYVTGVPNSGFAAEVSMDRTTVILYLAGGGGPTSGFTFFDAAAELVVGTQSVAQSAASVFEHDSRLFVGQACTDGKIFAFDKTSRLVVGTVNVGVAPLFGDCANSARFALTSDGQRGWAAVINHGVLAFDAQSYAVTGWFDIRAPAGDGDLGIARDIKLLNDRWLYVAKTAEGVDEIDITTGQTTRSYSATGALYPSLRELALSPNGRFLFVTGSPDLSGPSNIRAPLLFTVPGLQLRYAFEHRPGAIHDAAVFHPDGKRVFVMAEFKVDVYLVRPD